MHIPKGNEMRKLKTKHSYEQLVYVEELTVSIKGHGHLSTGALGTSTYYCTL